MGTATIGPPARGDLLLNLVRADLSARYRTTTLGILWFVLNPLLMMFILIAVFQRMIRLDIPHYPVFVLCAMLPWTFFQMSVSNAATSLPRSSGLVKKVRIPRVFVPLSAILASLVHFLISLAILFVVMALFAVPFTASLLWLPVVVLVETVFLTGISLAACSLNVFYRDVEYLLEPALRAMFYLTPSFYPLSYVPSRWLRWYLLNPMAGIIETFRQTVMLGSLPPFRVFAMSGLISAATLAAGIVIFQRAEPHFDDYL